MDRQWQLLAKSRSTAASPLEKRFPLAPIPPRSYIHQDIPKVASASISRPRTELIAGDTLFAGSIGRTDLPGGSMQKIIRSLHDTVLALPDETVVVPGHGELTTIGEERETNPFLVKR